MLVQCRRYHCSTTRCYLSSIPALGAVDRHRRSSSRSAARRRTASVAGRCCSLPATSSPRRKRQNTIAACANNILKQKASATSVAGRGRLSTCRVEGHEINKERHIRQNGTRDAKTENIQYLVIAGILSLLVARNKRLRGEPCSPVLFLSVEPILDIVALHNLSSSWRRQRSGAAYSRQKRSDNAFN